jgi:hypothetical protein
MSKEIKVDISPRVEAAIPPPTVSQMIFHTADRNARRNGVLKMVYGTPVGEVAVIFGPLGGPEDPHFACVGFADEPRIIELSESMAEGGDK